ncbi:phage tail protein [Listeria monocytogenes]|nr:phage tail protein [Listeria monocytogenes]
MATLPNKERVNMVGANVGATRKRRVKLGVDCLYYGLLDDTDKVKEVIPLPGVTEAKIEIKKESEGFPADNDPNWIILWGSSETTVDFTVSSFADEDKVNLFGYVKEDGMIIVEEDSIPSDIAVVFRVLFNDGVYGWVGLYKGQVSYNGLELKTKQTKPEAQTDGMTGLFSARGPRKRIMNTALEESPDFDLKKFFLEVLGVVPSDITLP